MALFSAFTHHLALSFLPQRDSIIITIAYLQQDALSRAKSRCQVTFGEIGLQHCLDGAPCTDRTPTVDCDPTEDTNPVGTEHYVVARALSINGDPIPGTTINFDILTGPNAGVAAQGVSDAAGEVQIEYTSDGTEGTDEIQASIGNLLSNVLTKVWESDAPPMKCDVDDDGDVDRDDYRAILGSRNQPATVTPPPYPATQTGSPASPSADRQA